jgi:ATP-dependent DNA helicase DinG
VRHDLPVRISSRIDPLELLAAAVAGLDGEQRDGQRSLATAVAEAIETGHHLVAEAPTGSGKSLAYLAPAVASGLKVVIATSTIALQSQLVGKDLPALHRHGTVPFSFALLKGRSNYLCRAKLRAAARPDALFEQPVVGSFSKQLEQLETFAAESETGDRSEVDDAIADSSWAAVSCTSMECPGRAQCADGDNCFAELARDRARGVDILVVNHALYCAHLSSRGNVLPDHDLVILDEAHAFPDNATNAFGADLAPDVLVRLSGMLARAGVEPAAVDALATAAKHLGNVVDSREGRVDVPNDAPLSSALVSVAERLTAANAKLGRSDTDATKRVAQLEVARLEVLRRLGAPAEEDVVWIEKVRGSRRIRIAPVSVGGPVGSFLLDARPVIAVSATLGGAPPFAGFAFQMGFNTEAQPGSWGDRDDDGRLESHAGRGYVPLQTPSSFDWKQQGLLYVAKDLPDPGRANDAWIEQGGERLCRLVNAAGGRALVLCTSHASVRRFADLLREETTHDVLAQGDADVGRLTRAFVEDETSVLVGTRSFWQGIDAPGVACVLVVIDRIPFPSPGDPLHAARRDRATALGMNAFGVVDLPAAALVLAQGAGRLIRTRADRGVVAVLDSRLANKDYRHQLLAAMPPFRRIVDLDEACAFLEDAAGAGRAASVEVLVEPIVELSEVDSIAVRNSVSCPECGSEVARRCRDSEGYTLAFLHPARIAAAAAAEDV